MSWAVRGVAKGVPDRWPAVYTAAGLPGWADDCATKITSAPVAASKKRILILGIGESGMVGIGSLADTLPAGYPRPDGTLWTYDTTRGWIAGVEPAHLPQAAIPSPGVGAGQIFCWRLQAALGGAYEVGFIACGFGGSTSVDWAVGGTRYNDAVAAATAALGVPNTVLGAIIHEQGINDPYNAITGWPSRWSAIETQMRIDLSNTIAPIYYVKQHVAMPGVGGSINPTNWAQLLTDQDSWASANRIKVLKPEGPWVDSQTHLATSAQVVLSQLYMDAWTAHPGVTA